MILLILLSVLLNSAASSQLINESDQNTNELVTNEIQSVEERAY